MNEKIIELEVKPGSPDETVEAAGGTMFEHNATALSFCLSPEYCLPEYKYYLEFVTVHGILRTAYLLPNETHKIIFSIPQEVTSQMTALAVLNIVAFDVAGKTKQLIKSQTVRLYFCNLENADKTLCENYAFSVNQLLEAIQKGTFKGEKGEQGPMGKTYTLLPTDKQEIADLVNKEHFGLPLYVKNTGTGQFLLPKITPVSSIRSLLISPAVPDHPVTLAKIVLGKNYLDAILIPEAHVLLRPNGGGADLNLGRLPEETYRVTTLQQKAGSVTTFLEYKNYRFKVSSHEENGWLDIAPESCFSIDSDDPCNLSLSRMLTEEEFKEALTTVWDGLTLTEKDQSFVLRQAFPMSLYYLNEMYKDSFDFLSGKMVKNTATVVITPEMIPDQPFFTVTDGNQTIYGYMIRFPKNSPRKRVVPQIGYCNMLTVVPTWLRHDEDLIRAVENGEPIEGICIGTKAPYVMLHSKKTAAEVKAMVQELSKIQPLEVVYPTSPHEEIIAPPQTVQLLQNIEDINVSPHFVEAEIEYAADISEKTSELESRIAELENRMNGENM